MKKIIIGLIALVVVAGAGFGWYYFLGPCGVNKVKAAKTEFSDLISEYQDAMDVASSTPRISLSGPIGKLQDIKRKVDDIEFPACMEAAQRFTVAGMEKSIDGFISFMGQADDSVVNSSLVSAFGFFDQATTELETITDCAPFCKIDPNRILP